MSNFNFQIKKETYEANLKHAQLLLTNDDIEDGLLYLNKSISVCKELINNCQIEELKEAYVSQLKKLNSLKESLKKGINPFSKTIKVNQPVKNNSFTSNIQSEEKEKDELHYFKKDSPKVTLNDIAGLDDVKEEIKINVIAPLKKADIFYKYSDNAGCQILMYGPPGCGKSFIAEAIAGELKCPYAIINTFDILDKYVGEAPKKIKEIFDEANKFDNCLIFFDEIDSLCASRESDDSSHTKDVLTAFLTCLSGFQVNDSNKHNIKVIIGATNRPWSLDSALLRGKRLDTHIYVGLPDAKAREFIIKKEFKNKDYLLENTNISVLDMVNALDGYSGADITSIIQKTIKEALKRALYDDSKNIDKIEPITKENFEKVKSNYRNSINQESLKAFEAFRNGEI